MQGKANVPNTYMNLADPSPVPERSKRCCLPQSVDAETIYSVGPHCTNVSTQQPMQNYSFDQSEADSVLLSAYAVLRESGYNVSLLSLMLLTLMPTVRVRSRCMTRWRRALWRDGSCRGAERALTLRRRLSHDMSSTATTKVAP